MVLPGLVAGLSLLVLVAQAQECWELTVVAFNTVSDPGGVVNWDSSNVHWTLYDTASGIGSDLSYGVAYKICGETTFKVTVAEVRSQSQAQVRTAWLLLDDHRIFTFSQPATRYNSIFFTMETVDLVQFTDWMVDDVHINPPTNLYLSNCRQMTVTVPTDRYAQVKVLDPNQQLAYYAYGNDHVLSQNSISFLPEICLDGNYTFDIVHQPFDTCNPTSMNWTLIYNYQEVYTNAIWQREISIINWNQGIVANVSTELFGSGTAHICPKTAAPSTNADGSDSTVSWVWILPLTGVLIGVVVVAWRDKICSYDFRRKYCGCKRKRPRRFPRQEQQAENKDDASESSASDDESYESQKRGAGRDVERGGLVKKSKKGKLSDILE
eukprot:TRINITY_DN79936_c0_g1_i1.p1 TRINITY_DN79936_c0_g1~~TRINITY_DN79936_c0_g1_i1.p1  ORF type:complete len:381 (-),score=59.24 TRINITY_DN79936_c0_g1_i1:35-1177(-)